MGMHEGSPTLMQVCAEGVTSKRHKQGRRARDSWAVLPIGIHGYIYSECDVTSRLQGGSYVWLRGSGITAHSLYCPVFLWWGEAARYCQGARPRSAGIQTCERG